MPKNNQKTDQQPSSSNTIGNDPKTRLPRYQFLALPDVSEMQEEAQRQPQSQQSKIAGPFK